MARSSQFQRACGVSMSIALVGGWATANAATNTDLFAVEPGNSWTYSVPKSTTPVVESISASTGLYQQSLPKIGTVYSTLTSVAATDTDPAKLQIGDLQLTYFGIPVSVELSNPISIMEFPMTMGVTNSEATQAVVTINIPGSATEKTGNAGTTVQLVGREIVSLPFGKVSAFKVKSRVSFSVPGFPTTKIDSYRWFVPNLGFVATGLSATFAKASALSDFSFPTANAVTLEAQGNVEVQHDQDADGLPDWKELAITKTDPIVADTDEDGLLDGEDKCPNHSTPSVQVGDQADADSDGVGDQCEQAQTGQIASGVIVDSTVADRDSVVAVLGHCEGLADALLALPDALLSKQDGKMWLPDTQNPIETNNVKVTLGEASVDVLPVIKSFVKRKNLYTLTYSPSPTSGAMTISLSPDKETISFKAKKQSLYLAPEVVAIPLRVEIGGWSCEASTDWTVKSLAGGKVKRYSLP